MVELATRARVAGLHAIWCPAAKDLPTDLAPDSATLNARFLAFIEAAATALGALVDFQIWNEPDGDFFSGGTSTQFATMIGGATELWKAIAGTRVIGPCPTANGLAFMTEVVASGALGPVDAHSVNCYVYPSEPEAFIANVQPFRELAGGLPLYNTELTWQSFRTTPGGDVSTYPTLMAQDQAAAYIWRALLAALRSGVDGLYWFGPDEHFIANISFGCIALIDADARSTLRPEGVAMREAIGLLTGAKLTDWSITGTLRSVAIRKNGMSGMILWRGDGLTGNVDLSGYSSGHDVYGEPIVLSSAYAVTGSPVVVFV